MKSMLGTEAFLRSCLQNLDDAAPRLIMADYLEIDCGLEDAANLRLPGYWWSVEDKTQLQVATIFYWRAPKADRKWFRIGLVHDYRPVCNGYAQHSDPRTWMGQEKGWECTWHNRNLWAVGNSMLAAEQAVFDKRWPRKRRKFPNTLAATDPKVPTLAERFAALARAAGN